MWLFFALLCLKCNTSNQPGTYFRYFPPEGVHKRPTYRKNQYHVFVMLQFSVKPLLGRGLVRDSFNDTTVVLASPSRWPKDLGRSFPNILLRGAVRRAKFSISCFSTWYGPRKEHNFVCMVNHKPFVTAYVMCFTSSKRSDQKGA